MVRIGPALVVAGMALLLVPLAEMMGAIGYFLIGSGFVLVGSVLTFVPDLLGSGTGERDQKNCPDCGAPNESDATSCACCETPLA